MAKVESNSSQGLTRQQILERIKQLKQNQGVMTTKKDEKVPHFDLSRSDKVSISQKAKSSKEAEPENQSNYSPPIEEENETKRVRVITFPDGERVYEPIRAKKAAPSKVTKIDIAEENRQAAKALEGLPNIAINYRSRFFNPPEVGKASRPSATEPATQKSQKPQEVVVRVVKSD